MKVTIITKNNKVDFPVVSSIKVNKNMLQLYKTDCNHHYCGLEFNDVMIYEEQLKRIIDIKVEE